MTELNLSERSIFYLTLIVKRNLIGSGWSRRPGRGLEACRGAVDQRL
jgi:hypothetical protein